MPNQTRTIKSKPNRSNMRKRLARHTRKRTQTGGGIWNRIRTLPGIRYFTKKNMQKTATTQCSIQDIAVLSRYDKRLPSSIIPLTSKNAQCLIVKHKQKNTHIFAYYTLDDQKDKPCPTYNLTYFDKSGKENTITDTNIGSILQVWPTNILPGLPPHVKYIIGKKYDDKVKEGQLVSFGSTTGRPRLDVVVSALQLILDSIPDSANTYKVVKLTSLDHLNEITNVDNCIIEANLTQIIQNINNYITNLNAIPSGTCKTLDTDNMFNAYRILSNALDTTNAQSIPIYFYTYENSSDYIFSNEKPNKLKFVKLSSTNIDKKPTPILPVLYKLDESILYSDFITKKPSEYILILKK
jgi:hypothetical protein